MPAPKELLAELSIGNPRETWQRLRQLGGDVAQVLPSSLPVLLATSLSLPPAAAGNLDEALPMVGALLAREGSSEPDVVIGMHVVSGAELVASLTLGDAAKLRRLELGPRLVRLLPAPGAPEFNGALGVSGNYLLLATRVEALTLAGRFVAESLPRRASSEVGLRLRAGEQVVSGSIAGVLRQAWQARRAALAARDRAEREAKGRPPDFADPEVLLSGIDSVVESGLGVLESARELVLEVVPEADRLRAELSLAPGADGPAALLASELVTGSLAPLLALPASTRAALLVRDSAAQDGESAVGAGAARLFGERLQPQQAARLTKTLDALARARSGATVIGVVDAPAPALVVACEVTDADAFSSAVSAALGLVELPAVDNWLAGTIGRPRLTLGKPAAGLSRARLSLLAAARSPGLPLPTELRLAWEAREGVGHVVVSPDPKLGPAALAEGPRLGESNWLTRSQSERGGTVAAALYIEAGLLLGTSRQVRSKPLMDEQVLLSFGKRGERVAVTLEAAPGALRALAASFR
ncbi:MAG TPA: hypothetical protein VIW29_06585 [Polyangiaceae bacterium]